MKRAALSLVVVVVAWLLLVTAACADNDLKSFGSGFIVDGRGYILTNEHVSTAPRPSR